MIRVAVAGACGRMGLRILTLAAQAGEFEIAGAFEQSGHPGLGRDAGELIGIKKLGICVSQDLEKMLGNADVLIDFTHHSVAADNLKYALSAKTGLVLGTTGLSDLFLEKLREASSVIPIVQAPNMSVGVNLLFKLAELTAKALDEDYDIEIAEIHHRLKKDAPSGTAMKLLEILSAARNRDLKKNTVYGREGETGVRPRGEIGVLALRGGDVVGEHTVSFFADGERVELVHKASSRDAFAQGALKAAKFLANKKSGLYDMQQVLGIS